MEIRKNFFGSWESHGMNFRFFPKLFLADDWKVKKFRKFYAHPFSQTDCKQCISVMILLFLIFTIESLPSEISTPSSTLPSSSSLPSTPLNTSRPHMLSGVTPPANSESLDPMFLQLWPHPQRITQIKGTRFFPTSSLHIVLFRRSQTGREVI